MATLARSQAAAGQELGMVNAQSRQCRRAHFVHESGISQPVQTGQSLWLRPKIEGDSMPAKRGGRRKYGNAAGKTVESAMRRRKRGTLKSGKGGKGGTVKSRKQATAIGLSEARKKGAKVPRKKAA